MSSLRNSLFLSSFAFLTFVTACGVQEQSSDVSGAINPVLRFERRGAIPVCVVKSSVSPALDQFVRSAVESAFNASVIRFSGWGDCQESDKTAGTIRVYYANDISSWCGSKAAGCSSVGSNRWGTAPGTLFIKDDGNFATWETWKKDDMKHIAVHEFGHAVGLHHEHERMDASNCADKPIDEVKLLNETGNNTVLYVGSYDTASVMNYCSGRKPTLSAGDIQAIEVLYHGKDCSKFGRIWATIGEGSKQSKSFADEVRWAKDHCDKGSEAGIARVKEVTKLAADEWMDKPCQDFARYYVGITKEVGVYNELDLNWAFKTCAARNADAKARIHKDLNAKLDLYFYSGAVPFRP